MNMKKKTRRANMPYEKKPITDFEFTTKFTTKPIVRKDRERYFFALTEMRDKETNEVRHFWKLSMQWKDKDGEWRFSKKSPNVKLAEMRDEFIDIVNEASELSTKMAQPGFSFPTEAKQTRQSSRMSDDPFGD
jgi:hypothetical protein